MAHSSASTSGAVKPGVAWKWVTQDNDLDQSQYYFDMVKQGTWNQQLPDLGTADRQRIESSFMNRYCPSSNAKYVKLIDSDRGLLTLPEGFEQCPDDVYVSVEFFKANGLTEDGNLSRVAVSYPWGRLDPVVFPQRTGNAPTTRNQAGLQTRVRYIPVRDDNGDAMLLRLDPGKIEEADQTKPTFWQQLLKRAIEIPQPAKSFLRAVDADMELWIRLGNKNDVFPLLTEARLKEIFEKVKAKNAIKSIYHVGEDAVAPADRSRYVFLAENPFGHYTTWIKNDTLQAYLKAYPDRPYPTSANAKTAASTMPTGAAKTRADAAEKTITDLQHWLVDPLMDNEIDAGSLTKAAGRRKDVDKQGAVMGSAPEIANKNFGWTRDPGQTTNQLKNSLWIAEWLHLAAFSWGGLLKDDFDFESSNHVSKLEKQQPPKTSPPNPPTASRPAASRPAAPSAPPTTPSTIPSAPTKPASGASPAAVGTSSSKPAKVPPKTGATNQPAVAPGVKTSAPAPKPTTTGSQNRPTADTTLSDQLASTHITPGSTPRPGNAQNDGAQATSGTPLEAVDRDFELTTSPPTDEDVSQLQQSFIDLESSPKLLQDYAELQRQKLVTSQIPMNFIIGTSETNSLMTRFEAAWQHLFKKEASIRGKLPKGIDRGKVQGALMILQAEENFVLRTNASAGPTASGQASSSLCTFARLKDLKDADGKPLAALSQEYSWLKFVVDYYVSMDKFSVILRRWIPHCQTHFYPFTRLFFTKGESLVDTAIIDMMYEKAVKDFAVDKADAKNATAPQDAAKSAKFTKEVTEAKDRYQQNYRDLKGKVIHDFRIGDAYATQEELKARTKEIWDKRDGVPQQLTTEKEQKQINKKREKLGFWGGEYPDISMVWRSSDGDLA